MIEIIKNIRHYEGISGFYKGFKPAMSKILFGNGIAYGAYEVCRKKFGLSKDQNVLEKAFNSDLIKRRSRDIINILFKLNYFQLFFYLIIAFNKLVDLKSFSIIYYITELIFNILFINKSDKKMKHSDKPTNEIFDIKEALIELIYDIKSTQKGDVLIYS